MLTSILTPVVHGEGQRVGRRVWLQLAALHTLGMIVSAAVAGGALATIAMAASRLGFEHHSWAPWAAASVALVYLPKQLGWADFPPLLQSTRQVPRRWAYDYPRWATAVLFGLGLGS